MAGALSHCGELRVDEPYQNGRLNLGGELMKHYDEHAGTAASEDSAKHKVSSQLNNSTQVGVRSTKEADAKPRRTWAQRLSGTIDLIMGLGDDLIAVVASTISPERIKWLWPERVPLGKLTLFVGEPNKGKSLAAIYVASATTTGNDWCGPQGPIPNPFAPSKVLIFADEDDPADTIVPRLIAAGANRQNVLFGKMQHVDKDATLQERLLNIRKDLGEIKKFLTQHPDVRLIILDPVSNYMGDYDMNKEQEVRKVLTPLAQLAQDTSVAVLGVMHLNKGEDKQAINRVSGAKAYVGVARSVWLFDSDSNEPEISLMLLVKQNLAEQKNGLKFRISSTNVEIGTEQVPQPFIEWLGESTSTADEQLGGHPQKKGRPPEQRDRAKEFLTYYLSLGPRPALDVYEKARKIGISKETLDRAKEDVDVQSIRTAEGWSWVLPPAK